MVPDDTSDPRDPSDPAEASDALPSEALVIGDIAFGNWFKRLHPRLRLVAGTPAPDTLRVPVSDANRLLSKTLRFVADLPAGSPGDVVWVQAESELLVHTERVAIACAPGLVTLSVPVSCDQLAQAATVTVPFAVGNAERTTGLVMSTLARPSGPAAVTAVWADALTAFAWEALLHLATELSGAVGNDRSGKRLVPGSIGAERDLLLVRPMARHDLKRRTA